MRARTSVRHVRKAGDIERLGIKLRRSICRPYRVVNAYRASTVELGVDDGVGRPLIGGGGSTGSRFIPFNSPRLRLEFSSTHVFTSLLLDWILRTAPLFWPLYDSMRCCCQQPRPQFARAFAMASWWVDLSSSVSSIIGADT